MPDPDPRYPAVNNLLSGLIGAVIGAAVGGIITAVATYKAAIAGARAAFTNELKLRALDRNSQVQASLSAQVLFDGTFYVRNTAAEALRLTIVQRRLFVDLENQPADDPNLRPQLMRRIHTGDSKSIVDLVRVGNTKTTDSVLATGEIIEIPECEMYGFVAEQIRHVIIGTLITISTLDGKVSAERLYVHRFTMGGIAGPHPQARWHQMFSSVTS